MTLSAIAVYCGSSSGLRSDYLIAARDFGQLLGEMGIALVYGGASVGLMGAVADGALAAKGRVIGVIPQRLVDRELAHPGLTELVVVDTMHQRKAEMSKRADAFVALPGGYGTLDELFEALTWNQLGIHDKPCGLLDVAGFYSLLAAFADHAAREGFVRAPHRAFLIAERDPRVLIERLDQARSS